MVAWRQVHPVHRPQTGLEGKIHYKKKKKNSDIKGLPRTRGLDTTFQNKGMEYKLLGYNQPCTCGTPCTQVVRLASSRLNPGPRAQGPSGQQFICPMRLLVPEAALPRESQGEGYISEVMLNTPDPGRQTWEAPRGGQHCLSRAAMR